MVAPQAYVNIYSTRRSDTHTHTHTHTHARTHTHTHTYTLCALWVGLYKILFYTKAFVHESIILLLPPPTCIACTIAILLHIYCAIYDAPPTPLLYAIHYTILATAISCKGQAVGRVGCCI